MKKVLLTLLLGLVGPCVWTVQAQAAPSVSLTTRLTLPAEGHLIEAEHHISVVEGGKINLLLPVQTVTEARLRPAGGGSDLQLETKEAKTVHEGTQLFATTFSFESQAGKRLILSYQSDSILRRYGANGTLMWSTFATGGEQKSISVLLPSKLGRPSIFGLPSSDSSFGDGRTSFEFTPRTTGQPVKLVFGGNGLWELDWSSTSLRNDGWWFRTAYVTLPPDTNQQRVWLESVSPKPRRLSVDRDGNLIAQYRLWPKRTLSLSARAYADVRPLFYNTANTRPLSDVPIELQDYTLREDGSKPPDDTKVLGQVRKFYDQAVKAARARQGDTQQLETEGQKIVTDLIDKLRRRLIPARQVSGVALANREQLVSPHQATSWVEVYIPGTGWMSVDPLDEQYGRADPLHIGLVIFGVPSAVPLSAHIDGLSLRPYEGTKLPDSQFGNTGVSLNRFILVPGLSLNRTQVAMPPGIVLDNAATTADGRQMAFGSLAPLQTMGRWSTSVGSQSWQGGTVQFGRGGEQGLGEVLAQGTAQTNYLLAAGELLLIILGVWWIVHRRRLRSAVGEVPPLEKQVADDTIATDDLLRRQ